MTTFQYSGTSGADYIDTWSLNYTYPGYSGFEIFGNAGDDSISLSISSRLGVDTAWGGDGDDFMSGNAYLSSYASAIFDGGYGNDRVYFSLMSPELNSAGLPNFTRESDLISQIKLSASDGSILTAAISESVERIGFGVSGETYLTEDLAKGMIRPVDWDEEYARTYYDNSDWYLKGLNTYDEYHGLNVLNIGNLASNQTNEYKASVNSSADYEVYFDINSSQNVYTYFTLSDFTDDLDLSLYKANSRGVYQLISSSDISGSDDEEFFKALSGGSYKVSTSFYQNLDASDSKSSFKLTIDTKSFILNTRLPRDPRFDQQWSLFNTGQASGIENEDIFAPEAWKIQSTSPDVVVAVIDSGIRTTHEDLRNNIWKNPYEISGNGIDDDRNGYVDDVSGWNFFENSNRWNPQAHGTHVAGLIAAEGNNSRGIAGVTWDAQLMCLNVANREQGMSLSDIYSAVRYAADNGADVINMSFGATATADMSTFKRDNLSLYNLLFDALNYAVDRGCVIVCAAGNKGQNTERYATIPASFSSLIPGVISVASVGNTGELAQYSNYSESITIAAPGGDFSSDKGSEMISTYHLSDSSYHYQSGTSMAAPLVSGAAALIMQRNRSLSPAQVENILTQSAFKHKALAGIVDEGNYLDLNSALEFTPVGDTTTITNDYARSLVDEVLTGSPQFSHNSFDSKFYNLGEGRYGVQKKGESTIDEITGVTSLQFQDQALSLANDVAATFNQVKGLDDVSGVVFRLYNAAFARLPDAKGLENWINGNSSGGMTYATSAQEFSSSQEFKNRYGATTTDTQYITTLYNNVLERSPDKAGLANYQNLLANGKERGALLLDFSESPENRVLFTQVTGLS